MAPERSWDVLLLGGPSGTGKSTLADVLAGRCRTRITEVDDPSGG